MMKENEVKQFLISGTIGYSIWKRNQKLILILHDNHSIESYCSKKSIWIANLLDQLSNWDIYVEEPDPEKFPPKLKLDEDKKFDGMYRASSTIKYKCVMYTRSNYRDFPFDNQTLEISCKLSSIRIPPRNAGTRPVACNPSRWRKDDGHQLIPEAGKYFKREESVHRVYGSTVVDISFPLSHFQTYFIVFFTFSSIVKHPNKSF